MPGIRIRGGPCPSTRYVIRWRGAAQAPTMASRSYAATAARKSAGAGQGGRGAATGAGAGARPAPSSAARAVSISGTVADLGVGSVGLARRRLEGEAGEAD